MQKNVSEKSKIMINNFLILLHTQCLLGKLIVFIFKFSMFRQGK